MKQKTLKKNRYCWVIAFACFLLSAASVGMLSYFNALFVTPVTEDLGISRATLSLYSTFSTVTTMLLLPFVGKLYARFSMRGLLIVGAVTGACAHLCYSLAQSVPLFYLGGILAGVCACIAGSAPITLLLSNWFVEKRGFATGLAFTGSSLVSSLFSPLMSDLIAEYGWRTGYRYISVGIFLTVLVALALIRPDPKSMGLPPYGGVASSGEPVTPSEGLTQKQTLRHPAYWLLALGIFLFGLMTMGTQQQLVAYWAQEGIAQERAVSLYSAVLLAGVVGKLLIGHIFDRFSVVTASLLCGAIAVGAYLCLLVCTGGGIALLPALLFGIMTAMQVILPAYLTQKFFGVKAFVSNVGLMTTILYMGVSVGTPASALVYDLTGSYHPIWIVYAVLSALAIASLLFANRLAMKKQS